MVWGGSRGARLGVKSQGFRLQGSGGFGLRGLWEGRAFGCQGSEVSAFRVLGLRV